MFDYVVNTNQGTPDVYFDGVYVGTVSGGKLTVSYPYKESGYTVTLQNCTVPASTEKYLVDELFFAAPSISGSFKCGLFGTVLYYWNDYENVAAIIGLSYYNNGEMDYPDPEKTSLRPVLCAKKQKIAYIKNTTGTIVDSITLNYNSNTTYTIHQVKANEDIEISFIQHNVYLDPEGTGEDFSDELIENMTLIEQGSAFSQFWRSDGWEAGYWDVSAEFLGYNGSNPEKSFSFNDGVKDYTGKLNIHSNKHFLDPNKYGGIIYL